MGIYEMKIGEKSSSIEVPINARGLTPSHMRVSKDKIVSTSRRCQRAHNSRSSLSDFPTMILNSPVHSTGKECAAHADTNEVQSTRLQHQYF